MLRIRPEILSELFTNLAAGWFGLVLITPTAITSESLMGTIMQTARALFAGIVSLLYAEHLAQINERRGV